MMKTANVSDHNVKLSPRTGGAVLLLVLITAAICSSLAAARLPVWWDEICTVIVCRTPTLSDMWNALARAADTQPPLYYLVCRVTHQLIPDDHTGYRLPSILGLLTTLACLYAVLGKRVDRLSALVGASFVLSTWFTRYTYQARPYALVIGCVSAAILSWQRVETSRLYCVGLILALTAAVSLNYYAILIWPSFVVAETTASIIYRRFRPLVWVSFVLSACPLLFFAPLLLAIRRSYGQHFWAARYGYGLTEMIHSYEFFNLGPRWSPLLPLAITFMALYVSRMNLVMNGRLVLKKTAVEGMPFEETVLALMLLWLPLCGFVVAKLGHNGMTGRYVLSAILGAAILLGSISNRVSPFGRGLLLCLLVLNYTFSTHSLLTSGKPITFKITEIPDGGSKMPIVFGDEMRYLQSAYYTRSDLRSNLYAVIDPKAALELTGTDSVDLNLPVLQRYFPLQVENYDDFIAKHRQFLLITGGEFDWWPRRLARDGYTLKLISEDGGAPIYKVTIAP